MDGSHLCMAVVGMTPIDAGTRMEIKMRLLDCHDFSGEMYLRVALDRAKAYMLGDTFIMRVVRT